jgi:hypothetical protein
MCRLGKELRNCRTERLVTGSIGSILPFRRPMHIDRPGKGDFVPTSGIPSGGAGRLLAGGLLCAVLSGCYVPNGGWTLRSGFDCRTHRKPAMFLEMVDTRWDEWNRVAQINAMQTTWEAPPPGAMASPPRHSSLPSSSLREPAQLPAVPEATATAQPAGRWMFRR